MISIPGKGGKTISYPSPKPGLPCGCLLTSELLRGHQHGERKNLTAGRLREKRWLGIFFTGEVWDKKPPSGLPKRRGKKLWIHPEGGERNGIWCRVLFNALRVCTKQHSQHPPGHGFGFCLKNCNSACSVVRGWGGQPGIYRSTGIRLFRSPMISSLP